jgi:glycosyltransferase involved in cell wall biosynthesis/cold shock CspA family protein
MESSGNDRPDYGIIVHCHLRWDFVWQRPQHLMSRLSKSHPILFLEDAMALPDDPDSKGQPRMQITRISDTLTVARPLLLPRTGDPEKDVEIDRENGEALLRLLDTTVHELKERDPKNWGRIVHWMYNPLAVWLKDRYSPIAAAYDCMDELANFKDGTQVLKEKEAELMSCADVVFTGGPSMYQARRDKHANVHQFNSGVDVEHFQKALDPQTTVPDDAASLKHPVLLYYGVIDERMGWDNLEAVCDAHPEWSVLMVGPLAKITEDDLLRRPNLFYTGQRGYEDLPGYLKASDVTLVPFALSDATRYLSPTKTLEYFAARRPVVSTPIIDIVEHYADAARVADTPQAFVKACEAALNTTDPEYQSRLDNGEKYAQANTWDSIEQRMRQLLDQAVEKNLSGRGSGSDSNRAAESYEAQREGEGGGDMATGQVRWYSASRGAGVVDTDEGGEVMAFLPGDAQENLGGVREGDSVAVGVAGPSHVAREEGGANIFPLGLDKLLGNEEPTEKK